MLKSQILWLFSEGKPSSQPISGSTITGMRIFALETDKNKIIKRFCHQNEKVVLVTYYHGFSFLFATLRETGITIGLVLLGGVAWYYQLPMGWVVGILFSIWFVFAFLNMLKAFIDWCYDMIIVTTDKVILVDQTSIFKQNINPVHLDNLGSITTQSQFWDALPFGVIRFHLKEGLGGDDIMKRYIPRYRDVSGVISQVMTAFQRTRQNVPTSVASAPPAAAQ